MRCDFIEPESSLWSRFLADAKHDFYHLPKYVALSARDPLCAPDADGEAIAFHAEDEQGNRFLSTLIVRPLPKSCESPTPLFDAITPYGYAGPLVIHAGGEIEQFLDNAIERMCAGLRERGIVSAFMRSHPTIPLPIEAARKTGTLVQHGQTVYVDLTLSTEEIWHQTRNGHRTEINKGKRNGYTVDIQSDWKDFNEFFRAYTETMCHVGANRNYFFSREYFADFRAAVGDVMTLAICRKGDAVACAGIFSEVCGIVQYHLSGTTDEFRTQYPTKIMLDAVRTWGKSRGNEIFHLGGGFGASEDSLFLFKAGFSHLRAPFYTWRLISDPDRYQMLCQQWETRTGKMASPPDGFFPAYRAP